MEIFEVKDSEALDLMIGAKSETAVKPKRRKREKIELVERIAKCLVRLESVLFK